MFGVIPKVLWARVAPPDDRNRIRLGTRPLLVRGSQTLLIDAGIGDKMDAKAADIFALDRAVALDQTLAAAGVTPAEIDIVLATHLHFDHVGGFTTRGRDGIVRPRFPNARYIVRRGEWDDARHPHERSRASYFADNYAPVETSGQLTLSMTMWRSCPVCGRCGLADIPHIISSCGSSRGDARPCSWRT